MAHFQRSSQAGETTQLFIQFLMMQKQQTLVALGRHPHPPAGAPAANLKLARLFIDQLTMLRRKTEGNLTGDEETLMASILGDLEANYREAAGGAQP